MMSEFSCEFLPVEDAHTPVADRVSTMKSDLIAFGPSEFVMNLGQILEVAVESLNAGVSACLVPIGEAGRLLWTRTSPRVAALVATVRMEGILLVRPTILQSISTDSTFQDVLNSLMGESILFASVVENEQFFGNYPALVPGSRPLSKVVERRIDSLGDESAEGIALRAGLSQILGDLDHCHTLAQSVEGKGSPPNGDYWHAIVHRREPDPGNAKYWFRHVVGHPIFPQLRTQALTILNACGHASTDLWRSRLEAPKWDAAAFVDLTSSCEQEPRSPLAQAARAIQWFEMLLLLSACAPAN